MSLLVSCLIWALLSSASGLNVTNNQNLTQTQRLHNDTLETATSAPEQEKPQLENSNRIRDEEPRLKFNPPDFFPFPKEGHVTQFWLDHPDLKAIPDLPAKDTKYPKWLLRVMGRIRPTTPFSDPTENSQIIFSLNSGPPQQPLDNSIVEFESGNFNSPILPKENDMEGQLVNNNVPVRIETENTRFLMPSGIPNQQPLVNTRRHQLRLLPDNIQRSTDGTARPDPTQNQIKPILFRIPLNLGLGRIQHLNIGNTPRNRNNIAIVAGNGFQNRPSVPIQMVPLQRQNFRGIPVTLSRPSVVSQPGILMLPVRNQNVPQHFNQENFIQSHPPRISTANEQMALMANQNHPRSPSFVRQNAVFVDPQFLRDRWSMVPVQNENSQRVANQRQPFIMQEKLANTWQDTMIPSNRSLPRRSGIGARTKRQSGFESFDPFGMGNMFSFFPAEKEEPPRNFFNWFPQESMMSSPTPRSPVSPSIFIPNTNQRQTKPPKQQITYPQDSWMMLPPSSGNSVPNFRSQNPQMNQGSSNKQVPNDFLIIHPDKPSQQRGSSNKMPWVLSTLFGGNLFPENSENRMWNFQKPFNQQPGTNNKQPPQVNQGPFSNDVPTRPFHGRRVPPVPDQQFPIQAPAQNFRPSHRPTEQRPTKHFLPPVNRNNVNQGNIQATSNLNQVETNVQPQKNWRPVHQVPVQPQKPATLHGKWIPTKGTQKKAPVSKMTHFHAVPPPNHHETHHHYPEKQPSKPVKAPEPQGDRRQSHRTAIQPEIQKDKRKLSPSEVRHLLSLLPEFPKKIYNKPKQSNPKGQTVGITLGTAGNRQKRLVHDSVLPLEDGNLTRNYPGPNQINQPAKNSKSSELPVRSLGSPKERQKRDTEDSLIQDVVFGTYGYHSEQNYQDRSFSDFSSPFFAPTSSNDHNGDLWGNMLPKGNHKWFTGFWDWPNHAYYRPHFDFGHFPFDQTVGHFHLPHHHNHWHRNGLPINEGHLPGGRRVEVIPPAVPRANPHQLSYTARFRYRFGIYPGYSDYIPATDNHEIFFFYDTEHGDRRPDAVIPFRSY